LGRISQTDKLHHVLSKNRLSDVKLLQDPLTYNKHTTIERLADDMMAAVKRVKVDDTNQQMWMFEGALVSGNKEYVELVKKKFTLIPEMQNICIRLIRDKN
jgi:hypothetical protein